MKKEQLADNVMLFCGDCRDVIPGLKGIDAVVSDPPYGTQDISVGYSRTAKGKSHAVSHIENDKNLDVVIEVFDLIKKQYKNIWLALFYSCRISPDFFRASAMFEYFGEVIWDKKVMGMGTQIRYQHENAAFFKLGKVPDLEQGPSVLGYMRTNGENGHPHEKPHQVMLNIVTMVPGKVILDPFMGSGSTGAAAVQLKRGFVGIEKDKKHFETALVKVSKSLATPTAFWE